MHNLNSTYFLQCRKIRQLVYGRQTLAFANATEWMHRGNNVTCSITKRINP